jgi:hypothetical protein
VDVLASVIIKRDMSNAFHQVEEDKFVANLDTAAMKTFNNVGIHLMIHFRRGTSTATLS